MYIVKHHESFKKSILTLTPTIKVYHIIGDKLDKLDIT